MCTVLRMPDGKFCETMGELAEWLGSDRAPPILPLGYPESIATRRDSCLCPVDLPALAKTLGATIDDSDCFETHLNGGDNS